MIKNKSSELNKKEINVCFIADDGYVTPTAAAISSLCYNSDKSCDYNIYVVMPENSSAVSKSYFIETAAEYSNVAVKVIEHSMNDLSNLHQFDDKKYLAATTTALLKFKLADVFSNLDKILYLDGDIIVRDDLSELYDYDISDYYVAAVRDLPQVLYSEQPLGKDISGMEYFNSGVMLLNLKKMRENDIESRLIETKKNHIDQSLMDQNIFNIVFKNSVLQLPFIYNTCYISLVESKHRYSMEKLNKLYSTTYKNVYEILDDIKIMHFSSKVKPWYFYDVPLADEWLFYYKKSAMHNVKIQRTFHTTRNVDIPEVKKQVKKLSELNYYGFKKVIPIVFAGNEQYIEYAAVSIQSIYENSNPEYLYDINILADSSLSATMRRKLNFLQYSNIKISIWDVRYSLSGINLYSVGHYSRQMYYRWLIPEVFSMYDKVLYLDCDIVVNSDIAELYDIDLGDNYIGAANNFLRDNLYNHVTNRLCLELDEYYNSGVLLINCSAWIDNFLKNKCIDCLKSYNKLPCPDQDVVNDVCRGKILKLDDKWNFQWHHNFEDARRGEFLLDYAERYDLLYNSKPNIIHFTSSVKPWEYPERPFAEYFWRYCRHSDFYEAILFNNISKLAKGEARRNETSYAAKIRKRIIKIKGSKTYKLACLINFIPRKIKGYNFLPIPPLGSNGKELKKCLSSIENSRAFKIAYKITALPRKIKAKLF